MKILAVDQARSGAWSVFDYESKKLLDTGVFNYDGNKYTYARFIVALTDYLQEVIDRHGIGCIFIEDTNLRLNAESFKKLSQLQGGLISHFVRKEYLYGIVPPSKWQSMCRELTKNEADKKAATRGKATEADGTKSSKTLSIDFVRDYFGIKTTNDNLADAICIGYWAVNNVEFGEDKKGSPVVIIKSTHKK